MLCSVTVLIESAENPLIYGAVSSHIISAIHAQIKCGKSNKGKYPVYKVYAFVEYKA